MKSIKKVINRIIDILIVLAGVFGLLLIISYQLICDGINNISKKVFGRKDDLIKNDWLNLNEEDYLDDYYE